MKRNVLFAITLLIAAGSALAIRQSTDQLSGSYLEVRSCDVYTGPCFANGEWGLAGKEGMLVWSIKDGAWNGADLSGLSVIAVIKTDGTLGDMRYQPRKAQAAFIVDSQASPAQEKALVEFARAKAGALIDSVVGIQRTPIQSSLGTCSKAGCASVKAGQLVEISTRCFGDGDHVCGNEETYYPPLTELEHAAPAYTKLAAYRGAMLNLTWELIDQRGAFIGTF